MMTLGSLLRTVAVALIASILIAPASQAQTYTVRDVQSWLTQLGYNPGPIDGSYGGRTAEALTNFYIAQGKQFDGTLDQNEVNDLLLELSDRQLRPKTNISTPNQDLKSITWEEPFTFRNFDDFRTKLVSCAQEQSCVILDFFYGDYIYVYIHLSANVLYTGKQDAKLETVLISWEVDKNELVINLKETGRTLRIDPSGWQATANLDGIELRDVILSSQFNFEYDLEFANQKRASILEQIIAERKAEEERIAAELAAEQKRLAEARAAEEKRIAEEKAELERLAAEQRAAEERTSILLVAFESLTPQQKTLLMEVLSETAEYNGIHDEKWSKDLELSLLSYIDSDYPWFDFKLPIDQDNAQQLMLDISSHFEKKLAFDLMIQEQEAERQRQIAEEKRLAEERAAEARRQEEAEAAKLREFCENASAPDFWKRFDFLKSEPISILGVDMSMTKNEIMQVLECRKYNCGNQTNIWGATNTVCKQGSSEIIILNEKITFDCASLRTCGLSLQEVSQALIDSGKVWSLEWEPWQDIDGNYHGQYCGRGTEKDILCVREFVFLNPLIYVDLIKGNLGKVGPSFD